MYYFQGTFFHGFCVVSCSAFLFVCFKSLIYSTNLHYYQDYCNIRKGGRT